MWERFLFFIYVKNNQYKNILGTTKFGGQWPRKPLLASGLIAVLNVNNGEGYRQGRLYLLPAPTGLYNLAKSPARSVHLFGPAYNTSCIRPEVRLPLDQRVLCSDCCKKNLLCLARVVLSYFVLHSSKIPLVLMTKVTHLCSLLFRQSDGVNCEVRRVYLAIIAKLSQNRVVQLVDYVC